MLSWFKLWYWKNYKQALLLSYYAAWMFIVKQKRNYQWNLLQGATITNIDHIFKQ